MEGEKAMMKKNKSAARTQVKTETTLTPMEEKVVRMRQGLRAPDNLILDQLGQDDPNVAAELAEIERRAIAAVGARSNPIKRNIIKSLRRKDN